MEAMNGHSKRTIESHVADYKAKMKAAKRTEGHISKTLYSIRQIAAFCNFRTAADINADGVNRYAADRRDKGDSSRTVQSHLTAIKGFTKWLTETEKLQRDPLLSVKRPNPKADRRYERRMLLPDEWQWLRMAVKADRYGMTAVERLLLYETAIQTGLRSAELRSLTRARLVLDSDTPYVTCKAADTKNAKEARQYIRPDLAARLRDHVSKLKPQAAVFKLPVDWKMAAMLRDDLAEARQAWLAEAGDKAERKQREQSDFLAVANHDGGKLDFHALRHTCGAWLAMGGVHPKVVQTVMRHSTIVLTMDTYGHLFPGQEAGAVTKMAEFLDTSSGKAPQRKAQQLERENEKPNATHCDSNATDSPKVGKRKSLKGSNLCEGMRGNATDCETRAAQTRTGNQRIMSQNGHV
jgi:integrase